MGWRLNIGSRDRAAYFKVGALTRSGYGGGGGDNLTRIFFFLVANNASRAAKCVNSCQFYIVKNKKKKIVNIKKLVEAIFFS